VRFAVSIVNACLRDGHGGSPTAVIDETAPIQTPLTDAGPVIAALGVAPGLLRPGACVATLGRARMLVPVATPEAVAAVTPDLDRLRAACDEFGFLGCYVHAGPTGAGHVTARMFAPSIGVPEDIANANGTACLAAHLAGRGVTDLTVNMGDVLDNPATITATAWQGRHGPRILVGGAAILTRSLTIAAG
jgi:trans-2,3-dihydro-3-hydroxyanthranilate isomerase